MGSTIWKDFMFTSYNICYQVGSLQLPRLRAVVLKMWTSQLNQTKVLVVIWDPVTSKRLLKVLYLFCAVKSDGVYNKCSFEFFLWLYYQPQNKHIWHEKSQFEWIEIIKEINFIWKNNFRLKKIIFRILKNI